MLRLFGLLVVLGLGFLGLSLLPMSDARRAGLSQTTALPPGEAVAGTAAAPGPEPAPALQHLPASVQRLADPPQTATLRPVIFGEATPIPVAAPVPVEVHATALRYEQSPYRAIKAQRANVRSGPSTQYEVIGQLTQGEEVSVLERDGSWLLVRLEGDGFEGWISASLLAE